jgi:Bacterial aa3 type cytochrome c oxidase subunit IV
MSSNHAGGHPDMDYPEHNRSYQRFVTGTKYAVIVLTVILVGMFVFLV